MNAEIDTAMMREALHLAIRAAAQARCPWARWW